MTLPAGLEIVDPTAPLGGFTHAVFDFDGTLSLVREGWQQVMEPMFVAELTALQTGETETQLREVVNEFVARLTGKQTIYQMFELAEQIRRRGGVPREPLEYKHEYLRRLESRIEKRIAGLIDGSHSPEAYLVPGAIEFLRRLRERGVTLCLASGTDEPFVKREAELLGLTGFFNGGVFGALDDYKSFSKKLVIERIISEHRLRGPQLLGVGDGYVEIENTRQAGGVALGTPVKEDEPTLFDEWKRRRLIDAGAQLLVPNFAEASKLVEFLFRT